MWLFLATEVMFFTGLIGSYIVLRAGSSHAAYSNLYSPDARRWPGTKTRTASGSNRPEKATTRSSTSCTPRRA